MEETYVHITKWNKSIWKGYMLYDILEKIKTMEIVKRSGSPGAGGGGREVNWQNTETF